MKILQASDRVLDTTSMVGIMAGFGMLVPAFLVSEMAFLAVPAFVVLLLGMICGTR